MSAGIGWTYSYTGTLSLDGKHLSGSWHTGDLVMTLQAGDHVGMTLQAGDLVGMTLQAPDSFALEHQLKR
jgi:hypothetical protein